MILLKISIVLMVLSCAVVLAYDFDNTNSMMKIFKTVLGASTSNNSRCMETLTTMKTQKLLPYLDASGKPGAGIISGNLMMMGNYDECMAIEDAHYCNMKNMAVKFKGHTVPVMSFGLCVPDVCDVNDAIGLLRMLAEKANDTFHIAITVDKLKPGQYGPNAHCYQKDRTFSSGTIGMIVVSGLIGLLCVIGSCIDIFQRMTGPDDKEDDTIVILNDCENNDASCGATHIKATNGPSSNSYKQQKFKQQHQQQQHQQQQQISMHKVHVNTGNNKLVEFFLCFSLIKNSKTLFDTTVPVGAITCLNGIRTISIIWVIMGHYLIFTLEAKLVNPEHALSWLKRFTMQPLLNGGLAVDTFFLLSGVLVSYLSMRRFEKHGKLPLVRYYVHRYIRLTPTYAYVIFFSSYLFPVLSDGPGWSTGDQEDHCKQYWWTNLLYINNFYPQSVMDICVPVSWYLSNDMQFYVISPIILWCIYKFKWRGVGLLSLFIIILHFLTNGILIHVEDASPLFFEPAAPQTSFNGGHSQMLSYQNYIYTKPYCRVVVYFMGLVLGYVFHRNCNFVPKIKSICCFLGWAMAVPLSLVVIYGPYTSSLHFWDEAENQAYGQLFRISWALCIGWVIYACHNKLGGLIDDFLSWRAFTPLSRLTYGVYLIHIYVIFLINDSARQPFYLNELNFSVRYTGVTVFSFCASYLMSVCIEYPVFNLEKLFLKF